MVYQTASDMFLDNRRGLEDGIKHLTEEDKEKVFNAYDWCVSQYLRHELSNKILKEEIDKEFGVGTVERIKAKTVYRSKELVEAYRQYYEDVESGKRVGYSEEYQ